MTNKDIQLLTYVGDDFDEWVSSNNPDRLPVVQYQTPRSPLPPGHLGGWVLRKPVNDDWRSIPLHADNENDAIAEATHMLRTGTD